MLETKRTDKWWIEPSLTAFGFLCFVIYTTWRALSGEYFVSENYLSPFYSGSAALFPTLLFLIFNKIFLTSSYSGSNCNALFQLIVALSNSPNL